MGEYSKPYKSFYQLVDKLIDENNLIVNDKAFAVHALETFSYYDLINGYKNVFTNDNEIYKEGISLEHILVFHMFDKELQSVLFQYSVMVENRFKNLLAHTLAKEIGVSEDQYLDPHYYRDGVGNITSEQTLNTIRKSLYTHYQPTKHYREKHNHIPPWILFKNISFSNAINLYSLTNKKLRQDVASHLIQCESLSLDEKVRTSTNALSIVRKYRNAIAHNLNFIEYKVTSRHKLETKIILKTYLRGLLTYYEIENSIGENDIYSMILSLILLLDSPLLVEAFLKKMSFLISSIKESAGSYRLFDDYSKITSIPANLDKRINNFLNK